MTCGGGGTQTRRRGIATPPSQDGKVCANEDATQTILCSRVEKCPPKPGKRYVCIFLLVRAFLSLLGIVIQKKKFSEKCAKSHSYSR